MGLLYWCADIMYLLEAEHVLDLDNTRCLLKSYEFLERHNALYFSHGFVGFLSLASGFPVRGLIPSF